VILLWHLSQPCGICIFGSPAASLSLRSQYFQLRNPRSRLALAALNEQLWVLQRIVLHPTYRGAGLAAAFVRKACELCPIPWIETLSAMGQANPFFERAGFVRVGIVEHFEANQQNGAFGNVKKHRNRKPENIRKNSNPVYYVLENKAKHHFFPGNNGPLDPETHSPLC
jgi:ribosomal protein S18 acetylase RimI-like enzyme